MSIRERDVVIVTETSGTVVCMFSVVQKRIALYTVLFWVMHVISSKPNLCLGKALIS